jgi:thiol-disulfide isomerase/thioredoxin
VIIKSISADLKGEDIFKALVAPYKGKQVLVDFWATWCGPCRAAMKTIQPVKEELMGKVAFIYITGPSSPKGTWNNMIQDIHGEHYYVTEEQWNSLLNQFESQGIPTYVIVDKEGNVQNKYIGYPGNDTMKAELCKQGASPSTPLQRERRVNCFAAGFRDCFEKLASDHSPLLQAMGRGWG